MGDIISLLFFIFLLQALVPFLGRRILEFRRGIAIQALERKRASRVITLIHRQEAVSFLGVPLARYIDIEDSEQVLRAIRMTPPEMPIDLVLHTPGADPGRGADRLRPQAPRGQGHGVRPPLRDERGTLIALAADEIVMDPNAVLGPVDPQLGTAQGYLPAASVLKALEEPNPNRDDQTLILGDVARKAIAQVHETVYTLLRDKLPRRRPGRWPGPCPRAGGPTTTRSPPRSSGGWGSR